VDFFIELQITTEFKNFVMSTKNSRTPGRKYTAFGPIKAGIVDEKSIQLQSDSFEDPLMAAEAGPVTTRMPFKSRTRFNHF
jgi:hypothetical protein